MNIPYDEMPEKIEELMTEVERLESENKHLLDLQKSMDQQYEELENENKQLKEILHNINASDGVTTTPVLDLIKENQQLKEDLHQASISIQEMVEMDIMCPTNCDKLNKYKSILDEIREVINQNMSSYSSCIKAFDEIEEILDKVK